jgi:very-short-patch-repair endonuclease
MVGGFDSMYKYVMPNHTSYQCCCIVCKQPKTSKGIHSHYLISHTEEGKIRNRKNLLAGGLLGANIAKNNAQKVQDQYLKSPNKCQQCQNHLTYNQRHNKFCSNSCSASFHNKKRKGVALDDSVKQKISFGIRKHHTLQQGKNSTPLYSKISFCCVCNSVIRNKIVKTCSSGCKSTCLSNNMLERIKKNKRSNYRRDKKSYLEESFESWLSQNDISLEYETEYTIHNHITQKWYFVDFYFPEINLIVELDGKQHEHPRHKENDRQRDEYIVNHLNIEVFRISYDEYQQGTKINQLLGKLVPRLGTAPSFTS